MSIEEDFADLHVHSGFSLLDGTTAPEGIVDHAAKIGRKYIAITDHGDISGWPSFYRAAEKKGVVPSFGCELYLIEHWNEDCKEKQKNLHLTAIAKTEEGQKKLIKAIGFANREGMRKSGFAARAFLPMDYALKNNWAGDIIIATGCASSPFWNAQDGIKLLESYKDAFKDDIYAETMPIYDWEEQQYINELAITEGKRLGIKPIATCDIHYLTKDDCQFHDVVIGLGQHGKTVSVPIGYGPGHRWGFESHCAHFHTNVQLVESFTKLGYTDALVRSMILNTREIAEKTIHTFKQTPVVLPNVYNVKSEEEEYGIFVDLITQGLESLGLVKDEYIDRLEREMGTIRRMNFVRYFLLVYDVIKWAKSNGILIGPSRGSVGGSLVAYCMNITNLDPIKYGLFFERFIDGKRTDLPDIDIDIDSRQRHLVEGYLKEKYGADNVVHVSTFGRLMGRAAIRDTARWFEVPLAEADAASKSIIHKYDADEDAEKTIECTLESGDPTLLAFANKYPDVVKYAQKLEGLVRTYGVHASGYVISEHSLKESDRCYLVDRNEQTSINWNGKDLEWCGFVKLDLLGLSTLSVIAEALNLIKKRHNKDIDLTKIPMDDKVTFAMLSQGETATVFQLHTVGVKKFCKELRPDNFEHLSAVPALWKPGPIMAGMTEKYKQVKLGLEQPEYLSKEYEEISKETFGQLIYQEQVVQILIKLAGFTFLEADKVRKIISKRQGLELLQAYEKTFVDGCVKVGSINSEVATLLWAKLVQFGIYVLNKSHAVGYSLLAYWCAYLKANYPSEWLCGYLNFANTDKENKDGEQEIDIALKEAVRLGISIKTPDINKSDVIWSVDPNGSLRVGLKDIAFVGDSAFALLAKIKAQGKVRTFEELLDGDGQVLNKRVLKSMLFCGALDEIEFTRINKERLILQFDDYWKAIGTKSKEAKFLESAKPEGDIQEIIDRERQEYLRFNPIAIHGGHSVKAVAKLLNLPFVESEAGEYIQGKGRQYNRQAVELCQMPGTGVRLVNATEGNFAKHSTDTKNCESCLLRKACPSPVPFKRGHLDLMIIGETPHSNGSQFHPNDKIWECLTEIGLEPNKVNVSTILKCRPPKGVKASVEEIMGCQWMEKELLMIKPKFVLSMGNVGLQYFKGLEKGINSYNAKTEWNGRFNCWITYSINTASLYFHPEHVSLLREAVKEFHRVYSQFV